MRINAGRFLRVATNGTRIHVDVPLTLEATDLCVAVIEHVGMTPNDVVALELVEGRALVEVVSVGSDGPTFRWLSAFA